MLVVQGMHLQFVTARGGNIKKKQQKTCYVVIGSMRLIKGLRYCRRGQQINTQDIQNYQQEVNWVCVIDL